MTAVHRIQPSRDAEVVFDNDTSCSDEEDMSCTDLPGRILRSLESAIVYRRKETAVSFASLL